MQWNFEAKFTTLMAEIKHSPIIDVVTKSYCSFSIMNSFKLIILLIKEKQPYGE
jgi:hypothetical protein